MGTLVFCLSGFYWKVHILATKKKKKSQKKVNSNSLTDGIASTEDPVPYVTLAVLTFEKQRKQRKQKN